jgi:hypothetical protein
VDVDVGTEPEAVGAVAERLDRMATLVEAQGRAPRLEAGDLGHPGAAVAATAFETAWRQEAEALAIDLAVVAAYLRAATDALVEADAGSIVRVEVGG